MKDEGRAIEDFNGRQREVFQIFINLNRANKHKMLPIPVCEIPKDFK
jgi:NAD+ synthase